MNSRSMLLGALCLLFSAVTSSQESYSSATMSVAKMYADARMDDPSALPSFPNPFQIIEEEIFNYHRHGIDRPVESGGVTLSALWGNEELSKFSDEAILQIGIATKKLNDLEEVPPVNLALVIDRSGSMEGDRIYKAKQSALMLAERLRPTDRVSLVAFDTSVEVVYPSQAIGDKKALIDAINSVTVGGSTDLNSGIIVGFRQAKIHCCSEFNNRVIVLTDALTNTGEIDPLNIVKNAGAYNEEIGFTMIGVGIDFNVSLARSLQESHNSSLHFINDSDDLTKVFDHEVEALLSPVARNPVLRVTFPKDMDLTACYGYSPDLKGNELEIELENINAGLTQIVLLKFDTRGVSEDQNIKAELAFYNINSQREEIIDLNSTLSYERGRERGYDKLANDEVRKNYTIAFMASRYKEAAELFYLKPGSDECYDVIEETLAIVDDVYPRRSIDKDVKYVRDVLKVYAPESDDFVSRSHW